MMHSAIEYGLGVKLAHEQCSQVHRGYAVAADTASTLNRTLCQVRPAINPISCPNAESFCAISPKSPAEHGAFGRGRDRWRR